MATTKNFSGALWDEPKQKVSTKTGNPYITYSGDCLIDGKPYWINAFRNKVNVGGAEKYVFNMSFNPKESKPDVLLDDENKPIPF